MAYSNRFVVCVLVNGHPQEELADNTVPIKYGSEYSLRFRNKNDRRAVVKFSIDGEDQSGNGYIVPANGYIDIHRHYGIDKAFKFVSLNSEEAIDAGKNGPNNDKTKGVVEARFYLEKAQQLRLKPIQEYHHHHYYPYYPYWSTPSVTFSDNSAVACSTTYTSSDSNILRCSGFVSQCNTSHLLSDGCTVEGGSTGQQFWSTSIDIEDNYTSVKLCLRGYSEPECCRANSECCQAVNEQCSDVKAIEDENAELRRKIAEAENKRLKDRLKELE